MIDFYLSWCKMWQTGCFVKGVGGVTAAVAITYLHLVARNSGKARWEFWVWLVESVWIHLSLRSLLVRQMTSHIPDSRRAEVRVCTVAILRYATSPRADGRTDCRPYSNRNSHGSSTQRMPGSLLYRGSVEFCWRVDSARWCAGIRSKLGDGMWVFADCADGPCRYGI